MTSLESLSELEQVAAARRMSHGNQLARIAHANPDAPALTFRGRTQTYADLNGRVSSIARGLSDLGVERGDRVGLFLTNRPAVIELFYAIMKIDAVVVPINFRLSAEEIDYIAADAGLRVLVTEDELLSTAQNLERVRDGDLTLVAVGEQEAAGVVPFAQLKEFDATDFLYDVPEEDNAFICYTSGTTGRPKGAVLTHMNLFMNSMTMAEQQNIGDNEVFLCGLPLFHIGGISGVLGQIITGAHIVLIDSGDFSAEGMVDTIEKYQGTGIFLVPTQWRMMCDVPNVTERTKSLRRIAWGASPATMSTLELMAERFPVPTFNAFGQTEMSSISTMLVGDDAIRKMGSVGKAVQNVEIRVVNNAGDECGPDEIGEATYRGATVMKEYWNKPEATAQAFADGWFHSGDLVRRDAEGFIYVVDRLKDMIISGGENIYTVEVENAIDAHPEVAQVAVIGAPHEHWVETPIAYVVPTDPANPPTEDEIIEFCKSQIASYKKPTAVHFVDVLPRNASGKVQKFRLREELAG